MSGRGPALNRLIGILTLGALGNIMNVPGDRQQVMTILVAVLLQSSFLPKQA